MNAQADLEPQTIRISVDTKAVINIGEYSRGGKSRGIKSVEALDHEMRPKQKLIPGGILEMKTAMPFLFFTESRKTSDFLADGIHLWWNYRKDELTHIKHLVINMDNGPECSGRRSQFLFRMIDFAEKTGLTVRLAYYPPYHSKYNGIEHYWGGLERSWNGYLLNSVQSTICRAANFTWKGMKTIVTKLNTVYENGVKLGRKEKRELEQRIKRSKKLPWWDILITPYLVF